MYNAREGSLLNDLMRSRMRYKLIVLFILLTSSLSWAEQRLPVQEGESVVASVSAAGLNRIAVQGDRIVSIKGTAGQFQIDKDSQLGQIFIRPTMTDKGEPIYLFVTTEKGATYGLSLLESDLAPGSIVLVPKLYKDSP